jgi:hypothetical protein
MTSPFPSYTPHVPAKPKTLSRQNINQITFYFVEEGPGCGSEDIKEDYNVNSFDFFFFSVFLMDVMGGKTTINLKELP